ncbi:MAG: hypothetical protein IKN46_01655, partial [Acholeplasmatales bacterium]|nr:hypothetical protein [Acholeplasmatales bacterium]
MIIYQHFQLFNDLIVYAKSQSPSAIVNMFANFVDVDTYDSYNLEKLIEKIPTEENALFNTKRDLTKFIFISYGDLDSNAYLSVISDKPDDIELYTSFKTFEDRLSPNPSTAQVYSMDLLKRNISLDFITTKTFAINIMSLYGEARIFSENEPHGIFYLRGAEDSLDYIIKEKEASNTLLYVENLRYGSEQYKNPGFAFILEFYLRNDNIGPDMLKIDETSEIVYKQADFPVYYYAKVFNTDKDINVFFYLHNVIYDSPDMETRTIVSNELIIKATVMEENQIYEIKEDSSKMPTNLEIKGVYDSALQAGSILIPKDNLKSFSLPTIFIAIEKGKDIKYDRIRGEFGLSTINGDAPVTEKLYQFGKIKDYRTIINYKLATDITTTKYMRIQFSCNSKYVNFAINVNKYQRVNSTFEEFTAKKERGIIFVTFKKPEYIDYIYLCVFLGQEPDHDIDKLNNYVFKYMNAISPDGFFEYKILYNDPSITLTSSNNNLKIGFNPIAHNYNDSGTSYIDTSIIYTAEIVTNQGSVNDENANIISIIESNLMAKQIKHDNLEKVEIDFNLDDAKDIKYIQVIATITQGSIIEYVAYQAVDGQGKAIEDPAPVEVIEPDFTQIQEVDFDKDQMPLIGHNDTTFHIKLSNKGYKNYFSIILNTTSEENPFIIISKDDKTCKNNRIILATQAVEPIYLFFKKEEIDNNEFYICVKNRKGIIYEEYIYYYEINIKNEDKANIPFNTETSYYVSDKNTVMKFAFNDDNIFLNNLNISIWAKGKDIINANI